MTKNRESLLPASLRLHRHKDNMTNRTERYKDQFYIQASSMTNRDVLSVIMSLNIPIFRLAHRLIKD